jgi:hypothetical protein
MTNEEYEIKLREVSVEVDLKAAELTEKLKVKIHPFSFFSGDKFVIGYMKEPNRLDKMRAIDLFDASRTQAGDYLLRTSLIHEESDKDILDENPKNDTIYLGAISFAIQILQISTEQLKKK